MNRYISSLSQVNNWRAYWKHYYALRKDWEAGDFDVKLSSGFELSIPRDLMSAFDEVFLRQVYGRRIKKFPKAPVILDLGANVGYFTLYMLSRHPKAKILGFEPLPKNVEMFQKHLDLNKLNNVTIDPRAVCGTEKSITINYNPSKDYTSGASMLSRDKATETIEIDAISLSDIFVEYELAHCDLLKVDVEGAEYNVIFNCSDECFEKIQNIVIEIHHFVPASEGTPADLIKFLESKGFRVDFHKNEILWATRA